MYYILNNDFNMWCFWISRSRNGRLLDKNKINYIGTYNSNKIIQNNMFKLNLMIQMK